MSSVTCRLFPRVCLTALVLLLPIAYSLLPSSPAFAIVSCAGTFTTTGETACLIPVNATSITITAIGGAGATGGDGGAAGGKADSVQATFSLPAGGVGAGGTLYVEVGSNGSAGGISTGGPGGSTASEAGGGSGGNGNGVGAGGGGGGSSDVRTCASGTCTLGSSDTRVLVAGGGGGGGGSPTGGSGGNAGGNGANASSGGSPAGGGFGATATSAGAGGAGSCGGGSGTGGGRGAGGSGGDGNAGSGGGGAGGGHFGGGGGGGGEDLCVIGGGGGGGGSDFTAAGATSVSSGPTSSTPSVTISFTCTGSCVFSSATTLTSSQNPSLTGQSVTFTATVACTGFTPTGTVTFKDGGMALATVTLSGAPPTATLTTSTLTAGSHSIAANYSGDANCGSSSAVLTQSVNTIGAGVALTSSANPSTTVQSVTFTATVTCNGGLTPTGSVTFTIDGTAGSAITLSGTPPTATFTTSSLSAGPHTVTAAYSGDANCAASTSSILTQVVNGAPVQAQPEEQPAVGLAYCYPAVNAPPLGTPCTPFYPNGSPATGPTAALTFCQTYYGSIAQQQTCIAAILGNIGGFICPIGCAHPHGGDASGNTGILPARLPGAYCTNPDGSRQWVPQGAPAPAGCT